MASPPPSDSQYISNLSPSPSSRDEVNSLPDSASSDDIDDVDDEEEESDAEKEWKESLQQLELLLTMVLVPYAGKYFGRKCAYWGMFVGRIREIGTDDGTGWAKFMEWKYPVEVVITNKKTFNAAGAVEAAASL